jgi:2-methylcitrate dehydratase PrpD
MQAIDGVVRFILGTDFQNIPSGVVEKAKVPFLDTIGVALAGTLEPSSRTAINLVREMGGTPMATVIGGGFKTSPLSAALANGVSCGAPLLDDYHAELLLHPSAILIPAILAVGEGTKASGRDILASYIIGWDVIAAIDRAAEAGHFAHRRRGWHTTCTIGNFGATAVAAKLLNLDDYQMRMAFGLIGSMASGTVQQYGTTAFPFHCGYAARNGVMAAMLAKRGIVAESDILQSKYGFFNLYSGEGNYDPSLVEGMGNPYSLVSPGFALKKYAACGLMPPNIESMQELVKRERFAPEDVESVEVGIHPLLKKQIAVYDFPSEPREAKFSEQFHTAAGIVYSDLIGLSPYEKERVSDPRVQELMKRVKVYIHPELADEQLGLISTHFIKVRLKDGREFSIKVDKASGYASKPFTREELLRKYRDCVGRVLSPSQIEQSIELLNALENLGDIGILTEVLATKACS